MKRLLLALAVLLASVAAQSQTVRIVAVDPPTNAITIQNFTNSSFDITGYELCALFSYKTINTSNFVVVSGSLNIPAGDVVIILNPLFFPLNNTASDLGLYVPSANFSDPNDMVDFVQWGSGGNGREPEAVSAGLWTAGTFVVGTSQLVYTGYGTQNGATYWDEWANVQRPRITSVNTTLDLISIANVGGATVDISNYQVCSMFSYQTISNLTVEFGSTTLASGDIVVLSGFSLNDSGGDLGLYVPSPNFSDPNDMVDFTQWETSGNGRETEADTKGIWTAGDFVSGTGPYGYTGVGIQYGANFWNATGMTVSVNATDPLCNGDCNGSASTTVTGAGAPFNYVWSDAQTTATATGLCSGSIGVLVIDSVGNANMGLGSLANPGVLTLAMDSIAATCGGTDGVASVMASGGTSPYTYLWSDAGMQTAPMATGLAAGVYTVSVTDANACSTVDSVQVNGFAVAIAPAATNEMCSSGDGAAWTVVSLGLAPYTYNWNSGQSTDSISGLAAGSYTVTVSGADGCSAIDSVSLTTTPAVAFATSSTAASCGNADGTASATPSAGDAPFSYAWDAAAGSQTDSLATALGAGTYSVTVTDFNGCTATGSESVIDLGDVAGSVSSTDATCQLANGSASITASGGTMPYTYVWGASAGSQTNATATGLASGMYAVTVTDASGCLFDTTVAVASNQILSLFTNATLDSCGYGVGSASVLPSGGSMPYTFDWSSGQSDSLLTNISGGTYTVTVTEAGGCVAVDTAFVLASLSFTTSTTAFQDVCVNGFGSAVVTPTGFTAPYSYAWDASAGNQTDSTATGLTAGQYYVTVTASNGCVQVDSATVTPGTALLLGVTAPTYACDSPATVSLDVTVSSGTPPYGFMWQDGSTGSSWSGPTPVNWMVTVTDGMGCIATGDGNISEPDYLSVELVAVEPVPSNGQPFGSVDVTVSGGEQPYTYAWSNGATTEDIDSLDVVGFYTISVTDANGCTDTLQVDVPGDNSIGTIGVMADVQVFPNPASDRIVISAGESILQSIEVFDLQGRLLNAERINGPGTQTISIRELPAGQYLLRIHSAVEVVARRLTVVR